MWEAYERRMEPSLGLPKDPQTWGKLRHGIERDWKAASRGFGRGLRKDAADQLETYGDNDNWEGGVNKGIFSFQCGNAAS
jgi:hypothetical protein